MSNKRGPYQGRTEYTLLSKATMKLPMSSDEQALNREFNRSYNRKCKHKQALTIEGRAYAMLSNAQGRAKRLGLQCTITREWIEAKLRQGVCEVTGIRFDLTRSPEHRTNKYAPSLDRIDGSKGYVADNVRCVVWIFNIARGEYSDTDLLDFAYLLLQKQLTSEAA